jgi:hypothetical protein
MPKKQSSPKLSSLASKVLRGKNESTTAKKLAGSVLGQDETKGQGTKKK